MAEQIENQAATQAHQIFTSSCERISYDIRVNVNEVDVEGFSKATKSTSAGSYSALGFAHCAPKHADTDYHLHVSWRVRRDTFRVEIEFVKGQIKASEDEPRPFAEDFIEWIEKFFVQKTINVRIDADFSYSSELRQTKFPLPARMPIGPRNSEVEVEGISFTLLDKPFGIVKIWMTQRSENLLVHVFAAKDKDLRSMDPREDIAGIAAVLDATLESKQTDTTNASEPV